MKTHKLILILLAILLVLPGLTQEEWVAQESGISNFLTDVFFVDENMGWITGWTGTVLYTENGGEQWSQQSPPPNNAYEGIYFTDSQTGWAVGYAGKIIHTTDGGEEWSDQESGTSFSIYDVQFMNNTTGWAVSGRHETINTDPARQVLGTTNGGETWSVLLSEIDEPPLLSLNFVDLMTGYAVGETGTILKTTDGGAQWTELMNDFQYHFRDVYFQDADIGWVVGQDLSVDHFAVIFSTDDGGESWEMQSFGNDETLTGISFADVNNGLAVGGNATDAVVLYTQDGGTTWQYEDAGVGQALSSVCFVNNEKGWAVGYDGTIIYREDEATGIRDNISSISISASQFPNPFSSTTTIQFTLEEASQVEVNIINSTGFQIESYRRNYLSGTHQFNWNPTGHSPGIYYYMVQAGERHIGGKMLLVE